jgi:uncharacterized alpha-E superfamily protein
LYWISRYIERAENVARLLDVGFELELDASGVAIGDGVLGPIESVLAILACRESFEKGHGSSEKDRDAVLRFLTFDRQNGHSILTMLGRARESARGTQETLSVDAWSQINKLYLYLCSPKAQRRFNHSPARFYDAIKRSCILFDGLVDGTLPRTEVFHFLQLGRYLERANQVSRILNVRLSGMAGDANVPLRMVHWSSLLRSCAAYETFLREYHDRIDPQGVIRYLVLDADFPRALRFCIARCCESLKEITEGDTAGYAAEAERKLGRLDSELRYVDVPEILDHGLSTFLDTVQESCNRIGDEIHHAYFFS